MLVKELDPETAIGFVRAYHYSKVIPRLCRKYLGFYERGVLSGVVILSWGTQPLQTIRKVFPNHRLSTGDYLEIGKMCFLPEKNGDKAFGSRTLSALIGWLRDNTACLFLYTLADGIMGKCGYVYQAANFRYLGSFTTSVYRSIQTGEKIHPRSAGILLKENAALDGVPKKSWLSYEFCRMKGIEKINGRMFRYIYPLTDKAAKLLNSYPAYRRLPYPKAKDLCFSLRIGEKQYAEIPPPVFDREAHQYNPQDYGGRKELRTLERPIEAPR